MFSEFISAEEIIDQVVVSSFVDLKSPLFEVLRVKMR